MIVGKTLFRASEMPSRVIGNTDYPKQPCVPGTWDMEGSVRSLGLRRRFPVTPAWGPLREEHVSTSLQGERVIHPQACSGLLREPVFAFKQTYIFLFRFRRRGCVARSNPGSKWPARSEAGWPGQVGSQDRTCASRSVRSPGIAARAADCSWAKASRPASQYRFQRPGLETDHPAHLGGFTLAGGRERGAAPVPRVQITLVTQPSVPGAGKSICNQKPLLETHNYPEV